MKTRLARHPILRLDVVGPDGSRMTEHRVFCQRRRQGVTVETCCACVHAVAVTGDQDASVECWVPAPAAPADHDPDGERTEVGALLQTGTVVVSRAASLESALDLIHAYDRRSVAIVGEGSALVGLIHETGLVGHRVLVGPGPVTAAMSTAIAIPERMPVRAALRLLAAHHAREATVVTDENVPLGTFRDVDGLHFVSRGRGHPEESAPEEASAGPDASAGPGTRGTR